MKYVKYLECTECGKRYPADQVMNLCPEDNRPVRLVLDTQAIAAQQPDLAWYHSDINNMWRFGALLPFDIGCEHDSHYIVSLGEGHTPVIGLNRYEPIKSLGLNVLMKDEGQAHPGFGANPTGSFKDRGMSMVASMAKYFGLSRLAVPTQGNAGDSLSEYGRHCGYDVAVVMPDDTPMNIMGKVAAYAARYDNIHLDLVKGTIREAGELMKQKYLPQGYFNCATFQEPGWRIEGKKTLGLELAEPWFGMKSNWELPDAIVYPTGGGTGILGMWKAFDELEALGVIGSRRPKIIAVQSENNSPVVDAIANQLEDTQPTDGGDTLATGLNVPGGVGHKEVLRILRASDGGAIAVSEAKMADHVTAIFKQFYLWISPEGAATVAALEHAMQQGLLQQGDTVVCFNTGSFEKYLADMRHLVQFSV